MISLIYSGSDEDLKKFPKILKSGYLNEVTKRSPYLLLQSEYSGAPPTGLTSQVGCCNMGEKILKLEQCFDEVTIAIIGIQLVSL